MKCPICDGLKFENFETQPWKDKTLGVCVGCGFTGYLTEPESEAKLLEFYRRGRPAPDVKALMTTNLKLNRIKIFLQEFLTANKGKKLVTLDIGAATGYVAKWLSNLGHACTGTEFSLVHRRFSENFYGIPLTEEVDRTHNYDLITIYHVLEHVTEPDVKLKGFVDLLTPQGRIMVSCPHYEDVAQTDGIPITTFGEMYHQNHINIFSFEDMRNLFAKCGLEIEKEEHISYGQTYLLKKAVKNTVGVHDPLRWTERVAVLKRHRDAIALYTKGEHENALDLDPRFPEAVLNLIFGKYLKSPDEQKRLFTEALEKMPDNIRLLSGYGEWLYQRQEWADSIKSFGRLMEFSPHEDYLLNIGFSQYFLGAPQEAIRTFAGVNKLNPMREVAMQWMCKVASEMPAWDERAMAALQREAAKGAPKPTPPALAPAN